MSNIAVRINDITKIYKLYDKPIDRLKESLSISKKKFHREHYALRNISFDVKKGESVGIIGTNGSGKSTLLKIITGVLTASTGNIEVKGRISALLELGAGFNMEYTGIENIYLNGTMMGYTKEEISKKINEILDFADIGDFVNQPVKTYSSGMFVRLAFAVAINIDPEILIVDEALSVGDVFFQAKCYKKFQEFRDTGKTIIFVSHDLSSVSKYCDKVVLLNKGEFVEEGEPKKIIDLYKKILVNQLEQHKEKEIEIIDNKKNIQETDINWRQKMSVNNEKLEYGDKKAEIFDFGIFDSKENLTNNILKNDIFSIKMKVRFNENIQEPIFAFTIKDIKGNEITGTNTLLEKINFDNPKKGEILTVIFKQNMNLQGGTYLLSLGCTGFREGNFTVYHRLYDICEIVVVSSKDSVGFFDMNSRIVIE